MTEITSPMPGFVHLLSDVPDPVFAQGVVGPGLALEPIGAGGQDVVAPIPGRIAKLHPHAFVISSDELTVLVHLGIDTVQLNGAGFVTHAAEGDEVRAGDVLITWQPDEVRAGGRSAICPIVVLDNSAEGCTTAVAAGGMVNPGDALLEV